MSKRIQFVFFILLSLYVSACAGKMQGGGGDGPGGGGGGGGQKRCRDCGRPLDAEGNPEEEAQLAGAQGALAPNNLDVNPALNGFDVGQSNPVFNAFGQPLFNGAFQGNNGIFDPGLGAAPTLDGVSVLPEEAQRALSSLPQTQETHGNAPSIAGTETGKAPDRRPIKDETVK